MVGILALFAGLGLGLAITLGNPNRFRPYVSGECSGYAAALNAARPESANKIECANLPMQSPSVVTPVRCACSAPYEVRP